MSQTPTHTDEPTETPREVPTQAPTEERPHNLQRIVDQVTNRLLQLLRLLFLVGEGIILVRVAFKALGANDSAVFAAFVYNVTAPLVAPFHPIFHDQQFNGHPLEVGSLVAVVFYAIALWLLVRLIRILHRGS